VYRQKRQFVLYSI